MNTQTAPTYHALKNLFDRASQPDSPDSPWRDADKDAVYEAMMFFYPIGAKVSAVYPNAGDLGSFRSFTGTVHGVERSDDGEPLFTIQDPSGFYVVVLGSLLTSEA